MSLCVLDSASQDSVDGFHVNVNEAAAYMEVLYGRAMYAHLTLSRHMVGMPLTLGDKVLP